MSLFRIQVNLFNYKMNTEKSKKFAGITQQLNKSLGKALQTFATSEEWADIRNWLGNVQSLLHDFPSPFIADKILLSKRLNQCMNYGLPEKVHEVVIKIHQKLFLNMKESVDGNINDYVRMFAQDLGVYSVSLLPYFVQTSSFQHRLQIAKIINNYYLDLGKELIPMLPGMLKSLLSVYSTTINSQLIHLIEHTLSKLHDVVGRRYIVGCTWSLVLKYTDCKLAGIKFLSRIIDKMEYIKGQQQYEESRGFSNLQQMLLEQEQIQNQIDAQKNVVAVNKVEIPQNEQQISPFQIPSAERKSHQNILRHLQQQENSPVNHIGFEQDSNSIPLSSPGQINSSPIRAIIEPGMFDSESDQTLFPVKTIQKEKPLSNIKEEAAEDFTESIQPSKKEPEQRNHRSLFQSQAPMLGISLMLKEEKDVKLNAVPLMMSSGIQQIRAGADDSTDPENNFPHVGSLGISALIACLQEQQPLIRRGALDFMFTHLRLKSQRLGEGEREVLIEALLRLFKKKQVSIIKRVNRWIFGKEDEEGRFVINEKNEYVIEYIKKAFRHILDTVPTSEENCTYALKILQNFYIEHPYLVERTLSEISLNLLRYIFNFGNRSDAFTRTNDFCQQVLKTGKRFLENLPSYYVVIFTSLGKSFVDGVRENKQKLSFEAIKYIDFCYITLMKHEHGYEQLQYITIILEYITEGLTIIAQNTSQTARLYRLFLKDAVLLMVNLIDRRRSVIKINTKQQESINQKYFESGAMELPPERIKFQQQLKQKYQNEQQRFIKINNKLEVFFVKLGYIVKNLANIIEYEQTFKLTSMAIVGLQRHLPKQGCKTLPQWFNTLEGAIKVTNPLVSLASIQAMIRCLMSQNKHPIYASFKNIIMQEKADKRGTDYQKLALQKLWSLLDYPHMHSKIIDLIVTFSKYFPYQFSQTVKRSFNTHSAPDKQASIQRFSHFWRLTAYKYKDLLCHKQFQELTKVGLFRMLDFLDDTNPLVRHAAKSWLMQSMNLLRRVMQPLLHELVMGCVQWYQTPKGIFLIQNVYDTNQIFSTFRRIRSILSNGSYSFLRFIYQAQISEQLDELREKVTNISTRFLTIQDEGFTKDPTISITLQRQPVLPRALQSVQKKQTKGVKISYLDLLLILAVKYIEGHAIQSMGVQFYVGNAGVNASAVELVQTLLDYIDNPILCEKVLDYIMEHLFKVLGQVVLNKEYIMQVQLINLIRNIFFNSSFRKKAELTKVRNFFKDVFTNKTFLKSILQGLNTPFAYVRSQFITFITMAIPLIADFLDPPQCTECIRHILFTYYRIIKEIGGTLSRTVLDQAPSANQVLQSQNALSMSKILQLQGRIKQQQKFVRFSDNLKQVGKTNQILSVLHGVQSILNYFYDLNKLDIKELGFQFTNPYTLFDTFKKIISLGLANSQKNAKLIEKKNFLHNFQTCEALLKDLQPVYQTILRSWPLSQEFVRIGSQQFSSVGMRSFSFERFSRYNKVVRDLITYVQQQKESIWGKIYCIMQPMFCKFPKQIIDIYLKIWIRQCSNPTITGKPLSDPNKTELLMKIMETIIVNNFPTNIVIHAFLQSTAISELSSYYRSKGSDKKGTVLDYAIDKSQAKLLYFLYVYFNYVYLNEKELTYQPLLQIWSLIMKVLKPFQQSRTPMSAIWIIQILNLCAKKYSPKELLKNESFKSDLHLLINDKLKYIAAVASRKEVFFFSQPLAKLKFEDQQKIDPYHIVLPLPPTIYDIFKNKVSERNNSDKLSLKQFNPGQNMEIESRYRVYCFKILKRLGLEILQNTYLPEKAHWVVVRAGQWMDIILPVIEDKAVHNQVFAQCASEVLFDLLDRARILFIKDLKPKVLNIFNKDDFFICNIPTLNYWAKIIDWVVSMDKNNQTYLQYLNKVSLSSSYFTSESVENKRRIKSFERICFILYSGSKDRYAHKLKTLLQKIADVIKKPQNVHAALLILILFSLRILILRLSEITLKQVFIDIWPMILTLLMQTFSKQLVRVHIHNQISKNPNYLLSALKLIEMISLTNLGQFAHHQWIFIMDYFGVDITVPSITSEMNEHFIKRPQLAKIIGTENRLNTTPFIYRPYLLNYLPQSGINYIPKPFQKGTVGYKPQKRLIIVKDSFIRDEAQLKLNALILMQYMINLNEFRSQVDWSQVQQVIVNDFITLDSFIHQIS